MTSHLLFEHLDRDHRRLLSNPERSEVYEHLEVCEECRELLCEVENVDEQIAQVLRDLDSEIENNFKPAIKKSHPSYEQKAAYVDGRLELDNRRSIESHLKICLQCQERVESLFRIRNDLVKTNSYRPTVESDDKWNIGTRSSLQWLRDHQLSGQKLQTWLVCMLVVTAGILSSIVLLKDAWQRPSSQAIDSSLAVPQAPVPSEQDTTHLTEFLGGKPRRSLPQVPSSNHRRETLSRGGKEFYGRNEMSVKTFTYPFDLSGSFAETAKRINQVLVAEDLARPKILSEFDDSETSLRAAEDGRRKKIKLVAPIRGVISNDRPTFRWKRLPGAVSYEVEVFDSRNHNLFPHQILLPTISEWTPPSPLPRGEIYAWVVKATTEDGEEIMAPVPPEPEMKFKVLEKSKIEELRGLRSQSVGHLLVGIFCAQEGLVVEAERELENFVGENPDSLLGRRLLRTVRAWKTR